jgi:hypothetical protein
METILVKKAREAWLHCWCDNGRIQSIRTLGGKRFFTTIWFNLGYIYVYYYFNHTLLILR